MTGPASPLTPLGSLTPLGIVAGGGHGPHRLIEFCQKTGRPFVLFTLTGHADADLQAGDIPHIPAGIGEAGRILDLAGQHGVQDIVLIGRVRRPSLSELKPDGFTLKLLGRVGLSLFGDDKLLQAVCREIEQAGFRVLGVQDVMSDFLMPSGCLTDTAPPAELRADMDRGVEVATALGRVDVGQSVVIQQGVVLGVEAVEGTDALLTRCALLKRDGPGGVLVKLCKPQQDRRLDLPAIGPDTVRQARAAGLQGIAVMAGATLLIDRAETIATANQLGLFLIGLDLK
jgi:UDP-2,3-diacylglucosamine hydrolase